MLRVTETGLVHRLRRFPAMDAAWTAALKQGGNTDIRKLRLEYVLFDPLELGHRVGGGFKRVLVVLRADKSGGAQRKYTKHTSGNTAAAHRAGRGAALSRPSKRTRVS